ncbi:group II intron reverse transcriptase/maturase [Mucilaginibacter paludis]|uniref:RNA-directed DNA polymerase (Reverse transcriptase) n=1 Tax=Mucilaginibacter paludis DSM 18603 TaxID=714943 RepID=H1Y7E6_9SPHI|nr:group II intron reverse transcriptase/maturase [Mucilaginibacter paludis]EHQ29033.1 RNA-directed DNA polymerase (Reverse transcriptase) [Mucilaginibacter paludis DSM 18603]
MVTNHKKVEAEGKQGELFKRRRREIPDAERVETLRGKLYQKAKQERKYKFYVLYDKLFIPYMLRAAWKQVKANDGVAGIDGIRISDVERGGVETYLHTLGEELRKQTYRPEAVKRVMIPKANGGERPLGIPTVKDRIAQTVCKMILEPIFEADFKEVSHGFRPGRSSKDAMTAIKGHLQAGKTEVFDADLSKYFDTIPHDKLLKTLKERISDPRILRLISMWLKVPVFEDGQFKGGKKNEFGTPQGGVISPLLSNIYLHLLDRIVTKPESIFSRMGVSIVRYADDFVLMGKVIPKEVLDRLKMILGKMGLTLNELKSKQIQSEQAPFSFLGHTIRYDKSLVSRNGRYWNISPSKKSEQRLRSGLSEYLKKRGHSPASEIVEELNSRIRGWLNYYIIKGVSYVQVSKRRLRNYLHEKLNRYYNRKSQRKCKLYRQRAFEALVQKKGLIDPTKYAF